MRQLRPTITSERAHDAHPRTENHATSHQCASAAGARTLHQRMGTRGGGVSASLCRSAEMKSAAASISRRSLGRPLTASLCMIATTSAIRSRRSGSPFAISMSIAMTSLPATRVSSTKILPLRVCVAIHTIAGGGRASSPVSEGLSAPLFLPFGRPQTGRNTRPTQPPRQARAVCLPVAWRGADRIRRSAPRFGAAR